MKNWKNERLKNGGLAPLLPPPHHPRAVFEISYFRLCPFLNYKSFTSPQGLHRPKLHRPGPTDIFCLTHIVFFCFDFELGYLTLKFWISCYSLILPGCISAEQYLASEGVAPPLDRACTLCFAAFLSTPYCSIPSLLSSLKLPTWPVWHQSL